MTRLLLPFTAFAALAPLVSAGIKFTSPAAGDKLTAGEAIEVEWEEGGTGPSISDLTTYQLILVGGGQEDAEQQVVKVLTSAGNFALGGNKASALVETGLPGASTPANAYFIKMVAVGKTGGELTTYSDRFSYSGMTGSWGTTVKAALDDLDGTDGPATKDTTGDSDGATTGASGDYGVAYTMQTGPTRYAPMQPVPPKKVTATNTKPLYPTSSVKIATALLPIPSIQTTITQSQTFSVSSVENTVSAKK
ncbi:Cell wall synthesis protein kre9 precursor [Nothophoma quercina]|uniref:Cell wall synthesis protein kre9 n=1 Tax=Nothophoma quercina TaxID=749835 RepID=A0ABR3RPC3_9PLEO